MALPGLIDTERAGNFDTNQLFNTNQLLNTNLPSIPTSDTYVPSKEMEFAMSTERCAKLMLGYMLDGYREVHPTSAFILDV